MTRRIVITERNREGEREREREREREKTSDLDKVGRSGRRHIRYTKEKSAEHSKLLRESKGIL